MSRCWVTSDWHLGHKAIIKYRKQFQTIIEHDECLFDNYNQLVGVRDVVWFLGDMLFVPDDYYIQRLKLLPGRKKLVLGNHDTERNVKIEDFAEVFEEIHGITKYSCAGGGAWLSHAPIHPMELRGHINIHGHCHRESVPDERYVNVCADHTDMAPVLLSGEGGILDPKKRAPQRVRGK